VYRMGPQFREA